MLIKRQDALERLRVMQKLVDKTIEKLEDLEDAAFEVSWNTPEQLASPATGKLIGRPCLAGPEFEDYLRFAAAVLVNGHHLGIRFKPSSRRRA